VSFLPWFGVHHNFIPFSTNLSFALAFAAGLGVTFAFTLTAAVAAFSHHAVATLALRCDSNRFANQSKTVGGECHQYHALREEPFLLIHASCGRKYERRQGRTFPPPK
jgi:hypothetical protein